jgi:hypothetical protein
MKKYLESEDLRFMKNIVNEETDLFYSLDPYHLPHPLHKLIEYKIVNYDKCGERIIDGVSLRLSFFGLWIMWTIENKKCPWLELQSEMRIIA